MKAHYTCSFTWIFLSSHPLPPNLSSAGTEPQVTLEELKFTCPSWMEKRPQDPQKEAKSHLDDRERAGQGSAEPSDGQPPPSSRLPGLIRAGAPAGKVSGEGLADLEPCPWWGLLLGTHRHNS